MGQVHVNMDLSHLQDKRQLQAKRDILEVAKADEVIMRRLLLVDLSIGPRGNLTWPDSLLSLNLP